MACRGGGEIREKGGASSDVFIGAEGGSHNTTGKREKIPSIQIPGIRAGEAPALKKKKKRFHKKRDKSST